MFWLNTSLPPIVSIRAIEIPESFRKTLLNMKIATWNVNSIRTRQSLVVDWLISNPVDILCLQETKVIDKDFPLNPFQELGYHCYISGQKSYNGVAIFSRTPIPDIYYGFTPILGETVSTWDEQKRVITAVFNDISIVNLYVPNGSSIGSDKYAYKLAWLKILESYLNKLTTQYVCICGDLNVALEDRDIYNPKGKENHIMASREERETLKRALGDVQDTFRKFTVDTGHYSWWDYRSGAFQRNHGWRIDYIFVNPDLYEQVTSCVIDVTPRQWPQPSDHTPVVVKW